MYNIISQLFENSNDNRGISSVVGFLLLFSVVLLSVIIGSFALFTSIDGVQQDEDLSIGQSTMEIIHNEIDMLQQSRSTDSREHPFSVSSGELQTGPSTTVRISRFDGTEPNRNIETFYEYDTEPIVYRNGDTDIVYLNGAVIRSETTTNGSVMISDPSLSFTTDRLLYMAPDISYNKFPIGGDINTRFRFTAEDRDILADDGDRKTLIELETQPEYADAWVMYGEIQEDIIVESSDSEHEDGEITYRINEDVSEITVFETQIDVS